MKALCTALSVLALAQVALSGGAALSGSVQLHQPWTWDMTGQLGIGPLVAHAAVWGQGDLPVWSAGGATLNLSPAGMSWETLWCVPEGALRYVHVDGEHDLGGVQLQWAWAWARASGATSLAHGAWCRIGQPRAFASGWAVSTSLGARPEPLTLTYSGADVEGCGRYTPELPPGERQLRWLESTAALWGRGWSVEADVGPDGFREGRVNLDVPIGPLSLGWELVVDWGGQRWDFSPCLSLWGGGVYLFTEVLWRPPLMIEAVRVYGVRLACRVDNASCEYLVSLNEERYDLVRDPFQERLSLRVQGEEMEKFNLEVYFWQGAPWPFGVGRLEMGAETPPTWASLFWEVALEPVGLTDLGGGVVVRW
ncbi:MAG: hypothetical protein ACP5G2_04570 [Candidatus Bipolaricaulaceae bacterium]